MPDDTDVDKDDDFYDARASSSSSDDEEPSSSSFVDAKTFSERFPLHRAAFDNDVPTLRRLLATMTRDQANAENDHGHTALHVAALRRAVGAVGTLCERRDVVDVDRRDSRGWDATRHATAQRARGCLRALVGARMEDSKTAFDARKEDLMTALRGTRDFEMRAGWRFGSAVVGALVKMVAPRDAYDVTCAGDKLRIDGELRGLDSERMGRSLVPKWRRGRFSLIFDGSRGERAKLWFVDHATREVVDATEQTKRTKGEDGDTTMIPEEMTEEEMIEAQVDALLMDGPSKKRVRTEEFRFQPVKGWIAGNAKSWIKGRKTEVWEASAKMTREIITPGGGYKLDGTFDEYCESVNEVRENVTRVKPLGASSSDDASGLSSPEQSRGKGHKPAKKPKAKRVRARCWLVRDFPINAAQLSKILEIFTLVNRSAKRVGDVVQYWRDNHPDVFPVKIQVPLALSVYAQLHFKDFKQLSAREREEKLESGFFDIPSDYRVKSLDELLDEAEERAYREMEFMESLENDDDDDDDAFGEETEEMKKLRKQLERMAAKEGRGEDEEDEDEEDEDEESDASLPRLKEEDEDEEDDF